MPPKRPQPRWYTIPVRVALLTFIFTLLSFAVSLLLGIAGMMGVAAYHHTNPDMRIAYRHFALTIALVAGIAVFVFSTVMEIRHYRQSKTLAGIARVSEEQLKMRA